MAVVIAAVLGVVVGGAVGVAAARWWTSRTMAAETVPRGDQPGADTLTDVSWPLGEAVDQLDIGVLVADQAGIVRYRNAAAQSFGGTHVGVLLDDHVTDALRITHTVTGRPTTEVVELQGPPKTWIELSADVLPSGGAVVAIRDVSERVRLDAMRTDFVTNISHELKTPVGAVAVLAEALIDEPDPAVVRRLSDRVVEEAHRAVQTIDDLLRLSEIESASPGDELVDLIDVVRRAVDRGHVTDGGRGVDIAFVEAPDRLVVRGDERQLVSAVGNLVENAVKYSNPGDVVQIRTTLDADADVVEVVVVDHGIGIPRRDLDRVFERFYRVDRARGRDTGGTGLGLAIVRHVATNHGGDVLVSSQEGEGSTFVFRLPSTLVIDGPEHDDATAATADQEQTS